MGEREVANRKTKYYTPNVQLVSHMRRRLLLSKSLQKIKEGEQIPREIEEEKAALSTQKTRVLDRKLFQAITDITFFFNVIGKHPEIQQYFDDDIKELLGVRRELPRSYNDYYDKPDKPAIPSYGFIFLALVQGILSTHSGRPGKDFRLRLTHELQRIIWHKISQYLLGVLGSEYTQESVRADFGRAIGWTEMLMFSMTEDDEKDEYRIPAVVPVNEKKGPTKEEKELIEERNKPYKQDIKRKSPHRTFDFSSVADIVRI